MIKYHVYVSSLSRDRVQLGFITRITNEDSVYGLGGEDKVLGEGYLKNNREIFNIY